MPIYDFVCRNTDCKKPSDVEGFTHTVPIRDRDNEFPCPFCEQPLKRVPSIPGGPHISWSKWRAV